MWKTITNRNQKVRKLILLSVIVHIFLFLTALHIYFSSPIEKGMTPHSSEISTVAKRVVVFVSDGVRADDIFTMSNEYRTSYLSHMRYTAGAWATCKTQVPIEPRPGHAAIFAGVYEDLSSITESWKNKKIEFDNVFYHSSNSWMWGNSDVLSMFNRGNLQKIRTYKYDNFYENSTNLKTIIDFDKWIFERVTNLFNYANETDLEDLHMDGNIFFLHLCGIDITRGAFNFDSDEHIDSIKLIDKHIKETVDLIENFYQDNQTTYIFTSDHGMTNWRTYGFGTVFESEAPFIIWGAGVKENNVAQHIMQGDIAPLISIILGINIPVNSLGILPDEFLDLSLKQRAFALFSNGLQLGDQLMVKRKNVENNTVPILYQPFKQLTSVHYTNLLKMIKYHLITQHYNDAINDSRKLIELEQTGLNYYKFYYKHSLLTCTALSLCFWVVYLMISIPNSFKQEPNRIIRKLLPMVTFSSKLEMVAIIGAFILTLWIVFYYAQVQLKYYIFFTIPLVLLALIMYEINQLIYSIILVFKYGLRKTFVKLLVYVIGIEIMVLTFFHRGFFLLIICGIAIWLYNDVDAPTCDKVVWFMLCIGASICPIIPEMPLHYNYVITLLVLSIYGYNMIMKLWKEIRQFKEITGTYRLLYIFTAVLQFFMVVLSGVVVVTVGVLNARNQQIPTCVHGVAWGILVTSLILIHFSPNFVMSRLFTIANSLVTIHALLSSSYEGLFMLIFVYFMHEWAMLEFYLVGVTYDNFAQMKFSEEPASIRSCGTEDFRRAFLFLTFIYLAYFGAGNIPSITSYNPMWIRCFVSQFNPVAIIFLSLLKITIPLLIATVFFRLINQFTGRCLISVFTIAMMYCDVLILNFMLLVKNEGSWLEIGLSISRFSVVSGMAIVIIIFYILAYFMTCSPFYDFFYNKFVFKPIGNAITQAAADDTI